MEFTYTTTPSQYAKFIKKTTTRKHLKLSLIGAAIFSVIMIYCFHNYSPINYLIVLGISIAYFGIIFLLLRIKLSLSIKKIIKKTGKPYFDSEKTIMLNEEGIEVKSIRSDSKIPYTEIENIAEDSEFITIRFKTGNIIFIPQSGIKDMTDKSELISLIKSKII